MNKLIKTSLITAILACGFNPLYAGSGHDHEHGHSHEKKKVTQSYAEKEATKEVKKLFERGKIDSSWTDAPIVNVEKKKFKNKMEWVISYENKNIKDGNKQVLYIFVNLYGKITGANFSGK
jgi:hypothetical protein